MSDDEESGYGIIEAVFDEEQEPSYEEPTALERHQHQEASKDPGVVAALAEAQEALKAAQEAQEKAKAAVEAANQAKRQAEEGARQAGRRALEEQNRAKERAKDKLRPLATSYEIEVTEVWKESKYRKAIEFIAHGAPNLTQYGAAPPALRAFVSTAPPPPRGWEEENTHYALPPPREDRRRALPSSAGGYRDQAPMPEPKLAMPRNRSMDAVFERGFVTPPGLTEAAVLEACRKALSIHLDLVDRQRLEAGEPEPDLNLPRRMKVWT